MPTNKKIRVAVLFGGRSAEHEVSLVSAQSVMDNLDKDKYEVIPIGISKEGRWIAGPDSMRLLKSGETPGESNFVLPAEPTKTLKQVQGDENMNGDISRHAELVSASTLRPFDKKIDVVFPVLHGPYGEDGTVQGFLELTGLPYVGAGVLASAAAMDKVMQKKIFQAEGLPQVKFIWFWYNEWAESDTTPRIKYGAGSNPSSPRRGLDELVKKIENELSYPVFVKPPNMGSSVGITKAHNREELQSAVDEAGQYDRKILIEEGIENAREIECSVLGNHDNIRASVPGEIIACNEFYDYDAKYVDGKSEAKIPADLPEAIIKKVQDLAVRGFRALDGEGMARVDFLLGPDNKLYINEVNTIPGFTSISMYPKLWQASGLSYPQLLDELIQLAVQRTQEKKQLRVSYQPKENWYK
jgi:D-alanine-D-alanine ligase